VRGSGGSELYPCYRAEIQAESIAGSNELLNRMAEPLMGYVRQETFLVTPVDPWCPSFHTAEGSRFFFRFFRILLAVACRGGYVPPSAVLFRPEENGLLPSENLA
jgi:hypothetical protein